jgi:phosphatidylglycerophosphate synthase
MAVIAMDDEPMGDYQPTSRRPIAGTFRRLANAPVRLCVRWGIHPDVISYLSIVASLAAAICFWRASAVPVLLLIGPMLCYVRLWCNMLDGMVALASGKASLRGEIVNDLPDRVSDMLVFAGVAHSGLNHVGSGYWAAMMALLTAYVGLFGQAVGARREFGGAMSKPWRMVVLHVAAWATFVMIRSGHRDLTYCKLSILDWTCLLIVIGCIQTIWVRLARIMRQLRAGRK